MNEIIIFGSMKMAEVIGHDQRVLVLLPRFGIDFGFGDKTVKQICQEKGIKTDFFLLMANSFLYPHYFPQKQLKNTDVKLLVLYLTKTHDFYTHEIIPRLRAQVKEFLNKLSHPAVHQLESFFNGYIREVIEHIDYEENVVFPYIKDMLANDQNKGGVKATGNFGIKDFQERHNNIEEKLSDLKSLLIKYFPPDELPYMRIRILNDLSDLEQDLTNHARLEDKVLIPVVEKIEKQNISR